MRWTGPLLVFVAYSQPLDAPKPFWWGASWGIGGVHLWARPALALRHHRTFWHFTPLPPYVSLGVSHPIGLFRARSRTDRPLYGALHLHQRYWPSRELQGDTRIFLLAGVRVWLEPYLQRFYLQGGVGIGVHRLGKAAWRALPTAEAQIGGFYRPHTYMPKRLRREGIDRW